MQLANVDTAVIKILITSSFGRCAAQCHLVDNLITSHNHQTWRSWMQVHCILTNIPSWPATRAFSNVSGELTHKTVTAILSGWQPFPPVMYLVLSVHLNIIELTMYVAVCVETDSYNGWCQRHQNHRLCSCPHSHELVIFSYFWNSYFLTYGQFVEYMNMHAVA